MTDNEKQLVANKIYGWVLESLTEFVQENTTDEDFEEVYNMVWNKFSKGDNR